MDKNVSTSEDFSQKIVSNKNEKEIVMKENNTFNEDKTTLSQLHVEIHGNTTVQLPVKYSVLEAVVTDETEDNDMSYTWTLIGKPDSTVRMEKELNSIKFFDVVPGLYQFKVKVTTTKSVGEAFANVTVLKIPRKNTPPVARVDYKTQEITFPNNKAFIDGSSSTDDDQIVSYLWELKSGPIQTDSTSNSVGHDKLLQLTDLSVGNYTYQLTVTDTDGETSSTDASVIVKQKIDHKPVANAGVGGIIQLPDDSVVLNGNQSVDDWGIQSYQWSIVPGSPVVDMEGARTPILHVTHMVEGEYTFQLLVTDTSDQTDTATVKIIVRPRSNDPPKADAGEDQLLLIPVEGPAKARLNGSLSSDDKQIASFHWEQIGLVLFSLLFPFFKFFLLINRKEPSEVDIEDADDMITDVTGFDVSGVYHFKLTVTDEQNEISVDQVSVTLKKEQLPRADAGPDLILQLPDDLLIISGLNSKDDYGIERFEWSRDKLSPAAGRVINSSDTSSTLMIVSLTEGKYIFHLKITNKRGRSSEDSVVVTVKSDPYITSLVELHLDSTSLSEEQKDEISKKLSILSTNPEVVVRSVFKDHHADDLVLLFYVKDASGAPVKSADVIKDLQPKINVDQQILGVPVKRLDTYGEESS